ncbi:hypothetical protein Poli38472_004138 [Pythium oligandrum]|uniref:CMP/dCMP-type deaminase domain-containing protein n=1 Tax=Pythium oligandrum TaxID=41045 RepID=A0A8K1FQ92_PYTOL|nr:hypothetical protein Poli38472_004138 [Pythium oligandrum]|eukprot:TMW66373.1 hypothetical protein Poli38472_004138 [Pythium oligandrum]
MTMAELLVEIVAPTEAEEDVNAQQSFHALAFPAKHGAQVMKHLSAKYGSLVDRGFPHLKRMKRHSTEPSQLIALIVPSTRGAENEAVAIDEEEASGLKEQFNGELCEVEVLKRGPKTREAWEEHTKQWPLIFHASVVPENQVEQIEDAEIKSMQGFLQIACDAGVQYRDQNVASDDFCCATGCVIVDPAVPAGANVVANSFAASQSDAYSFRTLFHPVMMAIDGVAVRDRERGDQAGPSKKQRRSEDSASAVTLSNGQASAESYLCTGYDVYVDVEPCVMCAMALIHSRARRVVFAHPNASDGALTSDHRLHTIKSLNHHYRAFHLKSQADPSSDKQ